MQLTLNQIGRLTGMNNMFIKGRAEGMGLPLVKIGNALVMTAENYLLLVEALRRDGYKIPASALELAAAS